MSTKATVTLSVTSFVAWDASASTGDPENCCKATASIDSSNTAKISLTTNSSDPTDFTININKPDSDWNLTFVVQPADDFEGVYTEFVPVGIALREQIGEGQDPTDPLGTDEFPSLKIAPVTIGSGKDKVTMRGLTFGDIEDKDNTTWDFLLMIQAVDNTHQDYPVGVIDPKIKGSTSRGN
jgi:hypothetical protein